MVKRECTVVFIQKELTATCNEENVHKSCHLLYILYHNDILYDIIYMISILVIIYFDIFYKTKQCGIINESIESKP